MTKAPRAKSADRGVTHASAEEPIIMAEPPKPVDHPDGSAETSAAPSLTHPALTHPDKLLYIREGFSKQAVAEYYEAIADWILPHIVGRPLSLVRCPDGWEPGTECFFQKHAGSMTLPAAISRLRVSGREELLMIEDLAGLIGLVQIGVLEIHPWGATAKAIERPDRLILDLDPDEGVAWHRVVEAALDLRGRLQRLGLECLAKTTGGKGLHLVIPVRPELAWTGAKNFTKAIVEAAVRDAPRDYTGTPSKAARRGKIFIDYLRNARGATAVAAYSTRARAKATVSAPLSWTEVTPEIIPTGFTIETLPQRLAALDADHSPDPWAELEEIAKQRVTAGMREAVGL
jgi:bifunctional non-homologous end joining protein LigD